MARVQGGLGDKLMIGVGVRGVNACKSCHHKNVRRSVCAFRASIGVAAWVLLKTMSGSNDIKVRYRQV
jgi:hypothetical protein